MRRTAISVGLGIALALCGCVHTEQTAGTEDLGRRKCFINMFADFIIQGQVQAAGSGQPIPHVRVSFVDTGLDYHRGTEAEPRRVGTSNSGGVIDQRYGYSWCIQTSFDELGVAPPELSGVPEDDRSVVLFEALGAALEEVNLARQFAIEIECDGFATFRRDVDLRSIPEHGDAYLVDLGAVVLMPSTSAVSGEGLE